MKTTHLFPLALGVLVLAGCETTGDPTQGGLFGWSEGKAKARSSALEQALYSEDDRTGAARRSNRRLEGTKSQTSAALASERARLNRMQSQLDDVEAKGGQTGALRSRINAASRDDSVSESQVRELDAEVRQMRSEYGLLQQRR
jgi:predicted  nucleic acid-binding Zn-ribbon protein